MKMRMHARELSAVLVMVTIGALLKEGVYVMVTKHLMVLLIRVSVEQVKCLPGQVMHLIANVLRVKYGIQLG